MTSRKDLPACGVKPRTFRLGPNRSDEIEVNVMQTRARRILTGLCVAPVALGLAFAQNMPKTTTERIPGAATVKTEQLRGTVVYVEGNHLVVKMSSGDMRTFDVPEARRFVIDGKEMKVGDLQPGT